ncbi:hypothetical protein ACOSQ4_013084 [Xanthoceras sorbifolium]
MPRNDTKREGEKARRISGFCTEKEKNKPILAGLLRLHFHDCFIRGCDASVLIDSQVDNIAEKVAPPNLTLRGFEVIDEIKGELKKQCKGMVSCAEVQYLHWQQEMELRWPEDRLMRSTHWEKRCHSFQLQ